MAESSDCKVNEGYVCRLLEIGDMNKDGKIQKEEFIIIMNNMMVANGVESTDIW